MAGAIKGITIQFRGDTSSLDQALTKVKKEAKSTANELKYIDKAIKFNPTSVDAWRQKQIVLNKAIKETEEKLKVMKDGLREMEAQGLNAENSEEFRRMQREIDQTERQLKGLKAELRGVGNVKLQAASQQFKQWGKSLENAGQKMRGLSIAAAAVTASIGALTVKSGAWADDLNTMSKRYGVGTQELQKYSLAAGLVDTSTEAIVKSQTKLKKSMLSAEQGSKNQAQAFEKLGIQVTNADGSLRDGEEVWQETIAALGEMTNETERDALAMQLMGKSANELNPLIEDGGETYKRLSETMSKYGLDFIDQETLDKANQFNDELDTIKAIGLVTLQSLGTELAGYLAPALGKVVEAVGKFAQWLKSLSPEVLAIVSAVGAFVAALAPALIVLGKMSTGVGALLGIFAKIAPLFGAVGKAAVGLVSTLGIWGVVIAAAVAAGILLYKNWDKIKAYAQKLWKTIKSTFQKIKDYIKDTWEKVKEVFSSAWLYIVKIVKEKINQVKTVISTVLKAIKAYITAELNAWKTLFTTVWKAIKTVVSTTLNAIKTVINTVFNAIKILITTYLNGWKTIFQVTWTAIQTLTTTALNAIKTVITTVFNAIKTFITSSVNGWKNIINTAWNGIKTVVTSAANAIKTTITTVFNAIKTFITSSVNGWKNIIDTAWNGIKTVVTSAVNAVKSTITSVFNAIKTTISNVWNSIKSTTSSVWNAIKTAITTPINAAKNTVSNIVNNIKSKISSGFSGLSSKVSSAFSAVKEAITKPLQTAIDKVSGIVSKIKGFFPIKLGKIMSLKLPKITIGTKSKTIMGKTISVPDFDITWNKKGAIFRSPTIFATPNGLQGVGEAGAEAVLPLDTLWKQMAGMGNTIVAGVTANQQRQDYLLEQLVQLNALMLEQMKQDKDLKIDGRVAGRIINDLVKV